MLEVKFYDTVDDSLLKFAVIISQSNGKWVFCKHKERDTYEAPGGHREVGEDILETAKRELQEETGAIQFDIKPICVYSVTGKNSVNETGEETFGLLCFAEVREFSGQLDSEMEKVVLMDELPQNWTYPLIQPKLIEKYLQIEKQSYSRIQLAAKQTIEYIKKIIKPGMNLLEIRKFCEEKLLELGADSFWYWDVGAFVFAGDETTVSVSGKQYVTSDRVIGNNDIITIDLSPQVGNIWGDYAKTIIVENGMVVENIGLIENPEWKSGLQMEEKLHAELLRFATKETTFEKLYYHMNECIVENGFVNLDFMPNVTQALLREHYRCHPKIINFCNQKFYRGELIIMTTDKGEEDVLAVVKTVAGNHERNHYSQRQIDVIKNEIIPKYVSNPEETGIIAPYKNQVEALSKEITDIDAATVHKFQGKEKENIIISTVDDEISDFADDPYLINVAVSRAKKKLMLVVTGNEQSRERNITELIDYIQYNNFEVNDS